MRTGKPVWIASGLRTPFTRVDGGLAARDTLALGVPVLQAMAAQLAPGAPIDLGIWGTVIPSLRYNNIARETWFDAKLDPHVPTMSVSAACVTSLLGAFEAAGIVASGVGELAIAGGSDSMTHVQAGLTQEMSDWLRHIQGAKDWRKRTSAAKKLPLHELGVHAPSLKNRTTHKTMGEHCEDMAKTWEIGRVEEDELALRSHVNAVAGQESGFFADLLVPVDGVDQDAFPRKDTSMEKLGRLALSFDRTSGHGTLTAGNSSPLTDGAAGVWVASDAGLERLPRKVPRAKLVDFQMGAVEIDKDGLLMAPAWAIPRLLLRNGLRYADIGLWEFHEAFTAQVLCTLKALDSASFLRDRVGVDPGFGTVPRERINPHGGSVALGHPFAATGARILSQAVKELGAMPPGTRAIVSVCADGGLGAVALLQAP